MSKTQIHGSQIKENTVTSNTILDNSINSDDIQINSIENKHINSINADKIKLVNANSKFKATNVEDALCELKDEIIPVDFTMENLTISGNILPKNNGTQDIGSATNRFRGLYVDEAYLSTNTLYIGDTPVLGTTMDTIEVKADLDQSITVKTTGTGQSKMISQNGVEISTSGMNADVKIQAIGSGARAVLSAQGEVNINSPSINLSGATNISNLTVSGNLNVKGTVFTVDSTTVRVADNIIEINKGEIGNGITAGQAGLRIDRGDAPDYLMVFDEINKNMMIGENGKLLPVATENYVQSEIQKINTLSFGTKAINETNIADGRILSYDSFTDKLIYVDKPLNSNISINDEIVSEDSTWSSNKLNSEITNLVENNNIELNKLNLNIGNLSSLSTSTKNNIVAAINELKILINSIPDNSNGTPGSSESYSLNQVTKLGVIISSTPRIIDITIPETNDFKTLPVEVLKFAVGNQNVMSTQCFFNNDDETDFESNDKFIFDGVMKLKTDYHYDLNRDDLWNEEGSLYYSNINNLSELQEIILLEVE